MYLSLSLFFLFFVSFCSGTMDSVAILYYLLRTICPLGHLQLHASYGHSLRHGCVMAGVSWGTVLILIPEFMVCCCSIDCHLWDSFLLPDNLHSARFSLCCSVRVETVFAIFSSLMSLCKTIPNMKVELCHAFGLLLPQEKMVWGRYHILKSYMLSLAQLLSKSATETWVTK